MAKSLFTLLALGFALSPTFALQVTPNSQCSSVCMDDPDQDKSDPNVSNTKGSDIVCRDQNYATPVGQKFERCLDCLQASSDKSVTESDLQWYLYNLRFAVTTCVYGLANATDPLSSPCSIQTSCGPLVGAIQDGMDQPAESNRYSYCTAFGGTFLGPRFAPCTRCLRLTEEQKYMGNFMYALKAACNQKPDVGRVLGLDGTLFSTVQVNETSAAAAPQPTSSSGASSGGLSTGAYAGIGVAGAFVIGFLIAVCIVARRKQKARKQRDFISSGLDDRFGNGRITVPVKGAYGDPYQPKLSPYNNVGMVNVRPRSEKDFGAPINIHDHKAHESFFAKGPYQRPLSMASQHTIPRSMAPAVPYATYNPARHESPLRSYSPAGSTQPADTPSHSPNHSPHSISDSTTHLRQASTSNETSNLTRQKGPPVIGASINKHAAPKRNSSNASIDSFKVRPGRHTRDLSVGRETEERNNISGPIITVSTRFDDSDEAKRKAERERLYRQGFKTKEPKEQSPDEEMWPGNY